MRERVMNKCIRISVYTHLTDDFLKNAVQKHAHKLNLEGFSQQMDENDFKIVVNGEKDHVDKFIDLLHKEFIDLDISDFEIEPFLKDRDYRGVFRIIQ